MCWNSLPVITNISWDTRRTAEANQDIKTFTKRFPLSPTGTAKPRNVYAPIHTLISRITLMPVTVNTATDGTTLNTSASWTRKPLITEITSNFHFENLY
jgi:hypothetical protein